MLCCWLQPLQEFGGPKVEKPDLLQVGTVGSHRPYLQTSTGNLARQTFFKVRRAMYNVNTSLSSYASYAYMKIVFAIHSRNL